MADEPVMNQVEWGRAAFPSAGVSFFILLESRELTNINLL